MSTLEFADPTCPLCKGLRQTSPYVAASEFDRFYTFERLFGNTAPVCAFCLFARAIIDLIRSSIGEVETFGGADIAIRGITQDIPRDDYRHQSPSYLLEEQLEETTLDEEGSITPDDVDYGPKLCTLRATVSFQAPKFRSYDYEVLLSLDSDEDYDAVNRMPW